MDHLTSQLGIKTDPDYPHLPYGTGAKHNLIAEAVLSREGVDRASLLPMQIDKQACPEFLRPGDPRFAETMDYIEWLSEEFDHKFAVEGNEGVLLPM